MLARFKHVGLGPHQTEWFICLWYSSVIVAYTSRDVWVLGEAHGGAHYQDSGCQVRASARAGRAGMSLATDSALK
jgi:hypothetical protein